LLLDRIERGSSTSRIALIAGLIAGRLGQLNSPRSLYSPKQAAKVLHYDPPWSDTISIKHCETYFGARDACRWSLKVRLIRIVSGKRLSSHQQLPHQLEAILVGHLTHGSCDLELRCQSSYREQKSSSTFTSCTPRVSHSSN